MPLSMQPPVVQLRRRWPQRWQAVLASSRRRMWGRRVLEAAAAPAAAALPRLAAVHR
jgi:hypothetical protein